MGTKQFNYYIFIDYSENLIGYIILNGNMVTECLSKISKLKHYNNLRKKKLYLKSMKNLFKRNNILSIFDKVQITEIRKNVELCSEVLDFCKNHKDSSIFISVDDRQHKGFMKLAELVDEKNLFIIK